jgi:hypothetical protein
MRAHQIHHAVLVLQITKFHRTTGRIYQILRIKRSYSKRKSQSQSHESVL